MVTYVKISELPPATEATGDSELEVNQAGVSRKITVDQIADVIAEILPPPDMSSVTISDTAPTSPADGDLWWDSTLGKLFVWYVDIDSGQWVPATPSSGGGGGGGDDLDTTPVAATGSTLARVVPDWLAGAPIFEFTDDADVLPEHRGAWLHMLNAVGSVVFLPNDWPAGMAFGIRQVGTGLVQWAYAGTIQMPPSKALHTGTAEQYEEIICRVITNTTGTNAVWGITGGTF